MLILQKPSSSTCFEVGKLLGVVLILCAGLYHILVIIFLSEHFYIMTMVIMAYGKVLF